MHQFLSPQPVRHRATSPATRLTLLPLRLKSALSAVLLLGVASGLVSCQPVIVETENGAASQSDRISTPAEVETAETIEAKPNETTEKNKPADRANKPAAEPIYPALDPGEYCYQAKDAGEIVNVRLTIDSTDQVTGEVHGLYTEAGIDYSRQLNGTIDGNNLNLDIATYIDAHKTNEQKTWKISKGALRTDEKTLIKQNCTAVDKAFENKDGIDAADLTEGVEFARRQPVYFESGKGSATVSNAVIRGDRDMYLLEAQGGQRMTISITSQEDNAAFDLISPGSKVLAHEATESTVVLPNTGEYQVIVGGTRGNATYDLTIVIE